MFLWIFKHVIISLVIIILIHYLYVFFKTNLTVPKIKDLVHRPEEKYKEIYNSIPQSIPEKHPEQKQEEKQTPNMKQELKNYLNNLKKEATPTSIFNNQQFSSF